MSSFIKLVVIHKTMYKIEINLSHSGKDESPFSSGSPYIDSPMK